MTARILPFPTREQREAFHPLIGVSPIYACGLAALEQLRIRPGHTLPLFHPEVRSTLRELWDARFDPPYGA
jgi:hypothetical protein